VKIVIAKTAGFCMGVRRAVEMVLDAARRQDAPIHTFGPLIHNPQVIEIFEEKGISAINDVPEKGVGAIIIRAHGVPPKVKEELQAAGFSVIDATCPRVIKVQAIIQKHTREGHAAIIIGDKAHPEVVGLLGYAGNQGHVVDTLEDLKKLPEFERAIIVAQTTQNTQFFEEVRAWASQTYPHYKVFNTICDSTEKRQTEVKRIAGLTDGIIIVGGHSSGNTKRLAEIARRAGKKTFHIETEAELDLNALSSIHSIGITAGASTPNWIIKKVFRKLESIPLQGSFNWQSALLLLQRSLLLTNIFVAVGAGALCYACAKLQGIDSYFPQILISMLYVQSMHVLNHLMGRQSDRYNDPDRADFYDKNKWMLSILLVVAGAAGLFTAYAMGLVPFFILLTMSVLGFSYNLRLIPESFAFHARFRRIRDIPGSKTVLITVAWGIVTAVFPALGESGELGIDTALVFIWAMSMVFVRTAFFDLLDMQGDRIVGKETIPILIGEQRALRLLKVLPLFSAAILVLASLSGIFSSLGFALVIPPLLLLFVIFASEKKLMLPGIHFEFLVEAHFLLAGVIAWLWSLFN
jgi:(E)-4-hydroxy-3-methyl-but-2-enyl pyrophosphate reductase